MEESGDGNREDEVVGVSKGSAALSTSLLIGTRPKVLLLGDSLTERGCDAERRGWVVQLFAHCSRFADIVVRGYSGYNSDLFLQLVRFSPKTNTSALPPEDVAPRLIGATPSGTRCNFENRNGGVSCPCCTPAVCSASSGRSSTSSGSSSSSSSISSGTCSSSTSSGSCSSCTSSGSSSSIAAACRRLPSSCEAALRHWPLALGSSLELVVLWLGANDACLPHHSCQHVCLPRYKENLYCILLHLLMSGSKGWFAAKRVLILTPPPVADESRWGRKNSVTAKYAAACVSLVEEFEKSDDKHLCHGTVTVCDVFAEMQRSADDWRTRFFCDGLHLSSQGNDWIYSAVKEHMGHLEAKSPDFPGWRSLLCAE